MRPPSDLPRRGGPRGTACPPIRLGAVCILERQDISGGPDDERDNTWEQLLSVEKMGWVGKRKSSGKARSYQKKLHMGKGAAYDWYVKESYEGRETKHSSENKYRMERAHKDMAEPQARKSKLS